MALKRRTTKLLRLAKETKPLGEVARTVRARDIKLIRKRMGRTFNKALAGSKLVKR